MDPRALLDDWLTTSALRPSSRQEYHREVTSWLTWCATRQPPLSPWHAEPADIAAWSHDCYLKPYLNGRPLDGPDALAHLARHHPQTAKSHDRRITALTQYYTAAADHRIIRHTPDLTLLRTGVDRDATPPRRLTRLERVAFFTCIGMWGPDKARNYRRDRLIAYLLLEGLRPGEIVRLDMRHLYELPDFTYEVRAPDHFENVGKKFTLEPLTVAALKAYLPHRPRPADGIHHLILGQTGRPIVSRYPNMLIRQMADGDPTLAQRTPPVTADVVAHTGFWDEPAD